MKVIFTFDDGKKSQLQWWNRVQAPATYFILPESAEAKNQYDKRLDSDICRWNETRALSRAGEIGFHGFSTSYDKMGAEKTESRINYGLSLIDINVGVKPVSFAYTNMQAGQIGVVSKMFPYIRDYFWRDLKGDTGEKEGYVFRMDAKDVPKEMLPYREKIFCMHPSLEIIHQLKRLNKIKEWGYEYCVLVMHEVTDKEIFIGQVLKEVYEIITFREIFEGQSRDAGSNPQPATVEKSAAEAGSTPAASPNEKEKE